MNTVTTEQIPIKLWLDDIEDGAMAQCRNLANLPFAFSHVAIMPDSHQGYGMPIGGVLATRDVIIPNAVGVDIGCGMCAVKTSLTDIDVTHLKRILGEIRKTIPVGFAHHATPQDAAFMPSHAKMSIFTVCGHQFENARTQIGTLGGGNHFIEIQKGSDGHIWIMIHSGSRNLGKQVADWYNKLAIEFNEKWHTKVPKEWELAFLPYTTDVCRDYLNDMQFCVNFAFANRKLMMDRICDIFQCTTDPMINIAHNYVALERHFGRDVWVHRKGATLASEGTIGLIPGSQGTASYVVKGKGNIHSFRSCSHGAGRKMGRKEAQRTLNLADEQKKLDDLGILHAIRGSDDLDEASGAYKDINVVMKNQEDLVDIITELRPLAVIKG
jgi:tRNA-splicing ligase RtcB